MVEERKSAGNMNSLDDNPSNTANPEYDDLMDLIYSGGDDGEPTVMIETDMDPGSNQMASSHSSLEPAAIPFVTLSESGELEISTEAMEFLDSMQ